MAKDRPPQSFADVISIADTGRIDRILSEKFAEQIEYVTDKASLHDREWKSELTIKIKVKAEPGGKIEIAFSKPTVKRDEEGMPKARMYYDPETRTVVNDPPRQVKIPGFDNEGRAVKVKSAAAPKMADKGDDE